MMLLDAAAIHVLKNPENNPKQICWNFLMPLWSSQNAFTQTVNCRASAALEGSGCHWNSPGFVSAMCSDCSIVLFSRALPVTGSAVGLGASGESVPVGAAAQLFLNLQYSSTAIIYSGLNTFPTPFKTLFLLEGSCPLLCFVVIFVMVV